MKRRRPGFAQKASALGAAFLLLVASAVPAPAAPPASETPIVLTADHLEYNTRTGVALADGQVRASRGSILITADHLEGNLTTGEVEALGHVMLKQGDRVVTGAALYFNFRAETGIIQDETTQVGPWHLTSDELELSGGQGVAYNASITPCDPKHPAFLVRARQIDFVPGVQLTAHDASLFLFGLRIVTLSTYQYSLRRDLTATTGPRIGFDNVNGAYVEYSAFSPWGSASNRLTVRLGTTSGLTAQDVVTDRAADHLWTVNLGRTQGYDQNGNLFSLDQYSLDLTYDAHRLGTWASYTLQGQAGSYREIATGVSATRGEALFTANSDAVRMTPNLLFIGSGEARVDAYGTGQGRTVLGGTVGVTDFVDPANSLSLTYNLASIGGATPFLFDAVSPDSTAALSYNYLGTGFLQGWGVTAAYSFLTLQTTLSANTALALSPTFLVSLAGSYNATTQQWNEVDVAVNATCDCLAVGLLYRMFPQTPSLNNLVFSVGLNPLASVINPFTP